MRSLNQFIPICVASALGAVLALSVNAYFDNRAYAAASPTLAQTHSIPSPITQTQQSIPTLAPMLQQVMPAVVSINTKQVVKVHNPFFSDPFFRKLFPDIPQQRINESLGSGVIIDAQQGYVITNHHVIENADDVQVTLSDGRSFKAEFIGSDANTDIALIRIKADRLTALHLANKNTLRVGDYVVAVGNPFGFTQTATAGIVSAIGRSGIRGLGYQDFIQTDASINPGNSGGALVDLRGTLVGINTASYNPQGSMAGNIGLGLAIPSDLASRVVHQLMTFGVVVRGTLGVETRTMPLQSSLSPNSDATSQGALVTRVIDHFPAASAGVKPGDIITAVGNQHIDSDEALRNFEGLQPVGSIVSLTLLRQGKVLHLSMPLEKQPNAVNGAQLDPRLSGATFVDLPESMHQSGINGVLVRSVQPNSRAQANGLMRGDIITAASNGTFADLISWCANFRTPPHQLIIRLLRDNTQYDALLE